MINDDLILTIINNNGVDVTDSRDVAKMLGKTHSNLMRDIRSCIRDMKKEANSEKSNVNSANSEKSNVNSANSQDFFIESTGVFHGGKR